MLPVGTTGNSLNVFVNWPLLATWPLLARAGPQLLLETLPLFECQLLFGNLWKYYIFYIVYLIIYLCMLVVVHFILFKNVKLVKLDL